jgi:hypothetical protein
MPAPLSDLESGKIELCVLQKLEQNPTVRVIISLQQFYRSAAAAREIEDKVISAVPPSEFQCLGRMENVAMIFGHATKRGVEEMARQPEVLRIHCSRRRRLLTSDQ